jgi:hypothetical protein
VGVTECEVSGSSFYLVTNMLLHFGVNVLGYVTATQVASGNQNEVKFTICS